MGKVEGGLSVVVNGGQLKIAYPPKQGPPS